MTIIINDFPMPITTPRLLLRPPILSDEDTYEYFEAVTKSTDELNLWLTWPKYLLSIHQAKKYIQACSNNWLSKNNNDIGLSLFICLKESKKFIGNITIWNIVWEIPKFEFGF